MDPDFPYFEENVFFKFPPVEQATPEGIVAIEGNLSPGMLLSAYRQGIFPWYSENEPILWWSPDPRMILFPGNVHVSRTMKKVFRKKLFSYTMDKDFRSVMNSCGTVPRDGNPGTWITVEMAEAYNLLHNRGWAHSLEVWHNGSLAGGLYGVSIGKVFFGESMFSSVSNASKAALIMLAEVLGDLGFLMIDCQMHTNHLESMGAEEVRRDSYFELLDQGLEGNTIRGSWADLADLEAAEKKIASGIRSETTDQRS